MAAERTSPRAGSGGGGDLPEPGLRPEAPAGRPGREGEGGRPRQRKAGGGRRAGGPRLRGPAGGGRGSSGRSRPGLGKVEVKVMEGRRWSEEPAIPGRGEGVSKWGGRSSLEGGRIS